MQNVWKMVEFLLTPLREGRQTVKSSMAYYVGFLLTPLREGRPAIFLDEAGILFISTHAPAGGATHNFRNCLQDHRFLLTPLREGRHA